MCNSPHVILHLPAKFHSNWMNIGRVLTSYRFFKMAVVDDDDDDDVLQLQANVKAYLTRKNYTNKLDFYKQHVCICDSINNMYEYVMCISQTALT